MVKSLSTFMAGAILILLSHQASACGTHFGLNADEYDPVTGTFLRLVGLASSAPAIKISHKPTASVELHERTVVTIGYDRRWFSKDMKLQLTASKQVELLDLEFELDAFRGEVTPRFVLTGNGFNFINISVTGEYDGEPVRRSTRIYVRANKPSRRGRTATAL